MQIRLIMEHLKKKSLNKKGAVSKVIEKDYKNNPLTDEQKKNNREKSRTRSRVEYIFGFMEMSMKGMYLYNIGKKRISAMIGLMNFTYNMFRKIQILSANRTSVPCS